MSQTWRRASLAVGAFIAICGLILWRYGAGVPMFVTGLVVMVLVMVDPTYKAPGESPGKRGLVDTGERFVDPETDSLVKVMFDPATGERSYVAIDDRNGVDRP